MDKDKASDNQKCLLLRAQGVEEIQTLVAIVSLGLCRALASGAIGPTYACTRLFGPALLTRMESLGSPAQLRDAVHLATELEDISELVPHVLQESIQAIEAKLVSAIGSLATESTDGERWLVPDAATNNEKCWTHELRAHLLALSREPGRPALDIEWLIARCDDTLVRYEGDWQQASFRQLMKDVASFADRFPGMLPHDFVCPPE